MFKNQRGIAHLLLLIAAAGLIVFLLVANIFDFRDRLFGNLFPKPSSKAESNVVPGEIVIQFKAGISEEAKTNARNRIKAVKKQTLKKAEPVTVKLNKEDLENVPPSPNLGETELAAVPLDREISDMITELQQDPNVVFAKPNTSNNQ